ncbi:MAG TPA: hypothetical protein DCX25_04385 [Candidatus Pacebacteria bacterium]|nr:MAG: hypothetical protein UX00_C0007G0037 [Microgenomates group bacterium GW2011_GWB1_45_17]KKU22884.1 MAG: hypothetical protein UX35_C0014G0012 [Microgenomates group bacterium GW2011_GWA1_46_15]KKU24436.1 MAG: hypothetical protein UX36_C0001G0053 [Microgenomates group bacterium GW2011_GWC1_46_15]HAV15541.1 hypothetical protein [Candidatus Paceibacterota bacterium]HCR10866.1 hypothetical protein [Candidatus Paceibacterota bacterium]
MSPTFRTLIVLLALVLSFTLVYSVSFALDCAGDSTCVSIQQDIDKLAEDLRLSVNATTPLEKQVAGLTSRINAAQAEINKAKKQADTLARGIQDREQSLAEQYAIFKQRVRDRYKREKTFSPLTLLFSSSTATEFTRQIGYWETLERRDQSIIQSVGEEILQLETDKKTLEVKQGQLAELQKNLDKQAAFFKGEISKAKAYQAELSGKIAVLSARQQEILSEKTGTFQTTVGDVPLADDFNASPAYNPGFSPAFAAFSFGAPHFKGMSQYGAYGRAKSGQNEEDILKAYYGNVRIETVDTGGNINTSSGSMNIEDRYLMGIAEMPSSWDANNLAALKAQAIAARSYGLAYVGWRMGSRSVKSSICTSENCQVWSSSKASSAPDNWKRAVQETRGKIVVSNASGEIVNTWYASTSGGYQESYSSLGHSTPGFWDTKNGRSGWTSDAYEKIGGSPWFYKAWYKSRSGDACGRSHPWLTQEEMADVLNAWVVLQAGSDDRVSPLGGCWGGSPYSIDELRNKANEKGGAFTSVSNVSIEYSEGGYTANVRFSTNKGDVSISGAEFKKAFNLRAPGRISLKSGLFSIEKR